MEVRIEEIREVDTLMLWRREVIGNVFGEVPSETLLAANRNYYLANIPSGKHQAFVARVDGEDVGCGAICYSDELPSPDNPSGRCAYLMNIYVREPFRHHGIGADIVVRLVEAARERGCDKIYLETTDDGRPVYTSLGFRDMKDMMKLEKIN